MASEYFMAKCVSCDGEVRIVVNRDGSLRKRKHPGKCYACTTLAGRAPYVPAPWQPEQRSCAQCGVKFIAPTAKSTYCTKRCAYAGKRRSRRDSNPDTYYASRRARDSKRRALKRTTQVEAILPREVFERDGYICHLCGEPTNRLAGNAFKRQDPKAPELEHIVSLTDGGTHTWSNVACACRACNAAKGTRSFGQMHLAFGPRKDWPELAKNTTL